MQRRYGRLGLHASHAFHHCQTHVHVFVVQHLLELRKQRTAGGRETQRDHRHFPRFGIARDERVLQQIGTLLIGDGGHTRRRREGQ